MYTAKQFCPAENKYMIFESCYSNRLSFINVLVATARQDFPDLADDDIEIVQYGGSRSIAFGIKFVADGPVPRGYEEVSELVYKP